MMGFSIYSFDPKRHPGLELFPIAYFSTSFVGDKKSTVSLAKVAGRCGLPMIVSQEFLPNDIRKASKDEVRETIEKFRKAAGWMREANPDGQIGLYESVPVRAYETVCGGDKAEMAKWWEAGKFLQPLAELFDWICPSLYFDKKVPQASIANWETIALAHIEAAKIYDKPVRPFLSPQYQVDIPKPLGGRVLLPSHWRRQLELVRSLCDGVILYMTRDIDRQNDSWQQAVKEME